MVEGSTEDEVERLTQDVKLSDKGSETMDRYQRFDGSEVL